VTERAWELLSMIAIVLILAYVRVSTGSGMIVIIMSKLPPPLS
jgi:hypothetical protein